jgi:hypothetical protein
MMPNFSWKFPWIDFPLKGDHPSADAKEPLREFVYLDEVSLASLLASQKGELTQNITAQSEEERLIENGGKIGVTAPLTLSAEASTRFQTTNSTALQTVRKANAQSLFRELHKLKHLRKIQSIEQRYSGSSLSELMAQPGNGLSFKARELKRGDLVEFQVKLSASWIFQISTMVAEFSEMFDESPALFIENVNFSDLYQAKNVNKMIHKLLAGLIPIDGLVTEYAVVEHEGEDYIVHNSAIEQFSVEKRPLQIVGVTDHLAYWKDIRRILFADSEFTVLCRLAKSGLQTEWNPIKLADIFSQFAPDLAGQIEASSRVAMAQSNRHREEPKVDLNSQHLLLALLRYKDLLIAQLSQAISAQDSQEIDKAISDFKFNGNSAEGQRAAFSEVKSFIETSTGEAIDPTLDFEIRDKIRAVQKLPLFPPLSHPNQGADSSVALQIDHSDNRLLDVEVVAIYW